MRKFISDTHFSHSNIISYCERPFPNTYEMNRHMIARWNSAVEDDDEVWHLGDVGFGKNEAIADIVRKLKGQKHLILGNHDRYKPKAYLEMGFLSVQEEKFIKEGRYRLYMRHRPPAKTDIWPLGVSRYLHGHIHNKSLTGFKNVINCSVEVIDYTPSTLPELLSRQV
jgi:calcineurin-like phosphoesterase family protein